MDLVIVHNHLRPGGVRRVIELATPALVQWLRPRVQRVIVATGDSTDGDGWWRSFAARLKPVPALCRTEPSLHYLSEQPNVSARACRQRLRRFFAELLGPLGAANAIVWAHNQGLGRNVLLTQELGRVCHRLRLPLVFHHHDWWFDNRWQRWPEMQRSGFRSLPQVAPILFPPGDLVRHVAINRADAAVLRHHFPNRSAWLPNPAGQDLSTPRGEAELGRRWLRARLGQSAPVWLMPCRLLRRKNIAEALLLTRWLRPEAWLVTTAGVSSPEERPYADRLKAAVRQHQWPLCLSVVEHGGRKVPSVPDLLAGSEAVLLTSLQEGFGLSYVEAAAAGRPLLARSLPNIAPDLARWGLTFPQAYTEVMVSTALFSWATERARQERLFRSWRENLPRTLRSKVSNPPVLEAVEAPASVPFSRLTLSAQLEVLAHPAEVSWAACVPFNRWLHQWRDAAAKARLGRTIWDPKADRSLSGVAFARRFARVLNSAKLPELSSVASVAAQQEFIVEKLQPQNLYPLTWSPET